MSPSRSPRVRRIARKLALLPLTTAALLVALAPASAVAAGPGGPEKGETAVDTHKPLGNGDGRKFK